MICRVAATGVPPSTMAVLMLSVFTVSMGYGVLLPLLPYLIERLLGIGGDATLGIGSIAEVLRRR